MSMHNENNANRKEHATNKFVRAIATDPFTKTTVDRPGRAPAQPVATGPACKIVAVDADCDDESDQIKLRIEAKVIEAVDTRFEP